MLVKWWDQSGVWVQGWEMNCVSASLRLDFRSRWPHSLSMMAPPSVTTFKHTQETQQTSMLASSFWPWFSCFFLLLLRAAHFAAKAHFVFTAPSHQVALECGIIASAAAAGGAAASLQSVSNFNEHVVSSSVSSDWTITRATIPACSLYEH